MTKRSPTLLAALALGLAAGPAAGGQSPDSGIAGRLVEGPTCPVEQVPPDSRCAPRPLVASLRITRDGAHRPGRVVKSRPDGHFRVTLAPGRYHVTPLAQPGSTLPRPPAPRVLTVSAGHFTRVVFEYDTGIR